jgi:DnaD/phage-associated family protein
MPNRIIKESIRTSRSINAMTDFQFRLWTYLITYVDDYGRGSADPELIKGLVFPRRKGITEAQIRDGLVNLASIGSIHLYEIDGESYLCFPNWSDHQRIQTKHSKFPPPPEDYGAEMKSTVIHGDSPPESNPIRIQSEAEEDVREAAATVYAYASGNLQSLSPRNMEELDSFTEDLDEDVIRYAIDEACANGKRTWAYTRAILNRCVQDGVKSVGDIKAREQKREKPAGKPVETAKAPKFFD